MSRTLDVDNLLEAEAEAKIISTKFDEWNSYRRKWIEERKELRNYVYATDTSTTSNKRLPWSNSTTTPKLTQIYDNLKANYTAALFPSAKWMHWQAEGADGSTKLKRDVIQNYMENKVRQSGFRLTAEQLVDDYILTGNCFATVEFVNNTKQDEDTGEIIQNYVGPKLVRISPYDIVFDPSAADFSYTPKIIRAIKTLGEVASELEGNPILEKILFNRGQVGSAHQTDKADGYIADGFSSIENYYQSSYVEFLTFYGDMFDHNTGKIHTNRKITVVDRAYVLYNDELDTWLGGHNIYHAGWRTRPDNLYAMGPLDNLVGLQYRIDHLENLRADIFDQIALPIIRIKGDVEDFELEPGARIYEGEDGSVGYLAPDGTALQADFQIGALENKMEELAGAPKMAMGLRTPGEKTAFEVQTLDNAANRIFNHKAAQFEMQFLEPALNAMLEVARRNMNFADVISVLDEDLGIQVFNTITKDDITATGKIVPMGARHFQEKARRVQTLTQLIQVKADPSVAVHLSGKGIAKILAEELNEPSLFGENIAVVEQRKAQSAMDDQEVQYQEELMDKQEMGR